MPDTSVTDFLLVIPAYKESLRLPGFLKALVQELSTARFSTQILVVDDGSPAEEQQRLLQIAQPSSQGSCSVRPALLLKANTRKGGAILAGWRLQNSCATWLAFVDADGAIPAPELRRLFEQVYQDNRHRAAYLATRNPSTAHPVQRSTLRQLAGRSFSWLAGKSIGLKLRDSQCGLKIVSSTAFERINTQLQGCGFCFDLELLQALSEPTLGLELIECPVSWNAQPDGKFHALRHTPRMLGQLLKLRLRACSRNAQP